MKVEAAEFDETVVTLDSYNSDLNLVLDAAGYSAHPLTNEGFAFMWAGARATHGVDKGKICFEVKIEEYLDVSHLPADEPNPHVVRVGFSVESSTLQLGEDPLSYGYGGTGKISTNCQFKDFGGSFAAGDVILSLLNMDADQVEIGYAKNGKFLGWAYKFNKSELKGQALFPHILTKNTSFAVNFGQKDKPYFPLPDDYSKSYIFLASVPMEQRVSGTRPPKKREDCEMIMMCGLPGAGKSVWAAEYAVKHPEKKYNILGTNNIIDKMKVMGLPRKRNYAGRWDVLIQMATKCLNKMFEIGSKMKRNYILDQTNVYPTAQRRKMRNFDGFKRIATVIVPSEEEYKRRCDKRDREEGKEVPDSAVNEMKSNFKLPEVNDVFNEVNFIELKKEEAEKLVKVYNDEGRAASGPARKQFRPRDSPGFGNQGFDSNKDSLNSNRSPRDGHQSRGESRGSYEGSDRGSSGGRGGYDDNQSGHGSRDSSRSGYGGREGTRSGYDGGRGGNRSGFDGNRGGRRGGYDGNRSGFRGGYEGNRGNNRGGYDDNRSGNRSRFEGNRGGFDNNRGRFDRNRGRFDGGYEGNEGRRGYDNPEHGGNRGFESGRGGYGNRGYQEDRGGYNDGESRMRGRDDRRYNQSPNQGGSPGGYGGNAQSQYGGNSGFGNNRGFNSSRGNKGFGGFDEAQSYNTFSNDNPADQYFGGYDRDSYAGRGQGYRGSQTRGRGNNSSSGGYDQGSYNSTVYGQDSSNTEGYGNYQNEYSDKSQGGYRGSSDTYGRGGGNSYGAGLQRDFKVEPNSAGGGYNSGSLPPTGAPRPSGRTSTRWSAEEPKNVSTPDTTSYTSYEAQVKTEPPSTAGTNAYGSYPTQSSGYGSYAPSNQTAQGYTSTQSYGYQQGAAANAAPPSYGYQQAATANVAPQSYGYQQSVAPAAPQQWTAPPTTAANPPAVQSTPDQSQWTQYYQQQSQPNQYYNQYYGQPASTTAPAYGTQ